jgi:serine/threonine protein kinase
VLEGSYNESCDMWSIGVIAYMLLVGRPPFWGANNDQLRHRIKLGTVRDTRDGGCIVENAIKVWSVALVSTQHGSRS